ncbi:hypothetical protein SLA_5957 [Streptomyces laurentii]|uniref:Uncharacterized protein n=1 Tax=Streptomyces laurentii TaxID=39478 RepID=A0A160P6N2_STRLU|nr:hypothetical protein SLA_5957 [Streptomyces laurentii]
MYDDATDTVKLYTDGYTNADATAHLANGWTRNGPLQVGAGATRPTAPTAGAST